MKPIKLMCVIMVTCMLLNGCGTKKVDVGHSASVSSTAVDEKTDYKDKESLQKKCQKVKKTKIGVSPSRLLYVTESTAIILDECAIVVFDLGENNVSDIVLLRDNDVMGDIFLQGDKASSISVSEDGRFVYIQKIIGEGGYRYNLETKVTEPYKRKETEPVFDSYESVRKKWYLTGFEKKWYLCGDEGIRINQKKFMYLINTDFTTLKGLTLVLCEGKEKQKIPVWK